VAELAVRVGAILGMDAGRLQVLRIAGILHDIGKLGIPSEILNKPSELTDLEYALIQTHAQRSYEIASEMPFDGPVAEITLQHHERFDGTGYPRGLQGEEIFLEARILAVCDVYEALTSHRPYRPAWPRQEAVDWIASLAGTAFDPACVEAFLAVAAEGIPTVPRGNGGGYGGRK
jgi:HD-GYP domain-containing protein (c-di-GMP phosphodiesterase class II)